ncbi:MAG: beta-ketoacyl synthase chain length factor [Betaproteobacteria bacterium]|nr:beta-ketoacyl synthase chain length factor [Betaproteobacteria bacterium]
MSRLAAVIESLAVIGPGLPDWPAARAVLAGEQPYAAAPAAVPAPALLPPNERRRSGLAVKIALAAGASALAAGRRDAADIETVFASSSADGDTCHAICEQLAGSERLISPTRFHNSVHNAPSGYWSIATRCMAPSTSVCGYDASFGAGLLEACALLHAHRAPVLLVAYDAPYPEPLLAKRPVADAFGVALLLAPEAGPGALARLEVAATPAAPMVLEDAALEGLRRTIPSARSLPLLRLLAGGAAGAAVLEYLDGYSLAVSVAPCA